MNLVFINLKNNSNYVMKVILIIVIILVIIIVIMSIISKSKYKNFDTKAMKKIIISMERSKDRKVYLEKTFPYNYTIFNAIDGNNIKESVYFDKDLLTSGQMGCFLSHISVWKTVYETVCIFEDDVRLVNLDLSFIPIDSDIIFLGHTAETIGEHVIDNVYKSVFPRGLFAYILTPHGAKKMLDYLNENVNVLPLDEIIAIMIYKKVINSYSIFPAIAVTGEMSSTINI